MPAPGDLDSADDPARCDVLALFADRARAVDPHFTLTVDNSRQVADVVARVDGLSLAVELAAARLRLFPLAELPRRLDDTMDALTKGPNDRPDRQRTLRDAISWSYHLLDPPHQALFRRLAVFRGGFTLDAAEAVASGPPVDDVLEGVSTLVEVSLLQPPNELGKARCWMPETIRAYAVDELRASGGEGESARRHAGFYARLIEEPNPSSPGPSRSNG